MAFPSRQDESEGFCVVSGVDLDQVEELSKYGTLSVSFRSWRVRANDLPYQSAPWRGRRPGTAWDSVSRMDGVMVRGTARRLQGYQRSQVATIYLGT